MARPIGSPLKFSNYIRLDKNLSPPTSHVKEVPWPAPGRPVLWPPGHPLNGTQKCKNVTTVSGFMFFFFLPLSDFFNVIGGRDDRDRI